MSAIIPGLGGYVCVRNGITLDYCFEAAIQSLLEVCEEVIACDSDSTDGTTELLQRWAEKEPRLKLRNFPWTNPTAVSHYFWIDWLNYARQQLSTPHQITVDADEILSDTPECRHALAEAVAQNKCLRVDRLNFFRDPCTLLPFDKVIGKWVVRFGPQEYTMCSDQPVHPGELPIVDQAVQEPRVKIFHLGFLREKYAFYRKARAVMQIWQGAPDERIVKAEQEGKTYGEMDHEWINEIVPYEDEYFPQLAKEWLWNRGWNVV